MNPIKEKQYFRSKWWSVSSNNHTMDWVRLNLSSFSPRLNSDAMSITGIWLSCVTDGVTLTKWVIKWSTHLLACPNSAKGYQIQIEVLDVDWWGLHWERWHRPSACTQPPGTHGWHHSDTITMSAALNLVVPQWVVVNENPEDNSSNSCVAISRISVKRCCVISQSSP